MSLVSTAETLKNTVAVLHQRMERDTYKDLANERYISRGTPTAIENGDVGRYADLARAFAKAVGTAVRLGVEAKPDDMDRPAFVEHLEARTQHLSKAFDCVSRASCINEGKRDSALVSLADAQVDMVEVVAAYTAHAKCKPAPV